MKPENQVCSLDLAKRLKELGVKQESLFYWVRGFNEVDEGSGKGRWPGSYTVKKWYIDTIDGIKTEHDIDQFSRDGFIISAFTVAELGEMLPSEIEKDGHFYSLAMSKTKKHYWVDYRYYTNTKELKMMHLATQEEDTEANARAKMLVYLLENKLL